MLDRADLHLERHAVLADHRGVQRLVAVGPRHRDEVLDAPRHRRPRLMDDAERRVAVLHVVGDDPERDEVVDLARARSSAASSFWWMLHRRLMRPSISTTGTCCLGAASRRSVVFSSPISPSVARRFSVDLGAQRFVGLRLEIPERQLLELVLAPCSCRGGWRSARRCRGSPARS